MFVLVFILVGIIYLFFFMMSFATGADCSSANPCPFWMFGSIIGGVWLAISNYYFSASITKKFTKPKRWHIIFTPFVAIPIFLTIIYFSV